MKGKTDCFFTGSDDGDFYLTLASMVCQDTISLVKDTWIAEDKAGRISVIKGPVQWDGPWRGYNRDVYKKEPSEGGGCVYRFVYTELVNRCSYILPGKARLCKHEALPGGAFCRQHSQAKPS